MNQLIEKMKELENQRREAARIYGMGASHTKPGHPATDGANGNAARNTRSALMPPNDPSSATRPPNA